jgi:hypothetical protein
VSSTADIVRMLEARPDWAPQVRRVRGGYLKIQGTWLPYEVCYLSLCTLSFQLRPRIDSVDVELPVSQRAVRAAVGNTLTWVLLISVAWPIRRDLIPLFGYVTIFL